MDSRGEAEEVRLEVKRCIKSLSECLNTEDVTIALHTLASYLSEGPQPQTSAREEFSRNHYTAVLEFLVRNLSSDWLQLLNTAQRSELWDGLFLRGPPDQAFLVLADAITFISQSTGQEQVVLVFERYLHAGRIAELLWSRCLVSSFSDSPQLRETLLGRLVCLPDIMANRLYPNIRPLFLPAQYYTLLAREMSVALERTCKALRGGQDCSLSFVAQLLGKACVQGHSHDVFGDLVPLLSANTRSDMVWQRVSWRLLENVPERWMESVVMGLVRVADGPAALSHIMGNLVVKNKKAQFVLTHKLLLLQYKCETTVLRSLLGYLAQDKDRRLLLLQVLRSLCQAWSNGSAVRHTPLEQQLYVSRCLLLCVGLLDDRELQELRGELLQCLLGGMQAHLDSNVMRIRRIGMVVGECLSSRLETHGTKLKFEYEQDEETMGLASMMNPLLEEQPAEKSCSPQSIPLPEQVESKDSQTKVGVPAAGEENPAAKPDSELDSDDDLTPYDMSADQEMAKAVSPRYIRDCLDALISSEDPTRLELSLRMTEGLVRKNVSTACEVSVELTKVLLHLEDKYNTPGFLVMRQAAMVALLVVDSIAVAQYLTAEFYSLNYSLRQRMDILEVLVLSAQELSLPLKGRKLPSSALQSAPATAPVVSTWNASDWRQVVEQRIQSKTRRLSKVGSGQTSTVTPNRYAAVAGCFFFPLLRNYDRPQTTFDLLGSDHVVLGKLTHTLGVLMQLAVNAPVAPQMGRALLDFVWAVRYHTDQVVRQGVLFSVCSVILSLPRESLLGELSDHLLETRAWLSDVSDGDPDAFCRSLAEQCLVLLQKCLKEQLETTVLSLQS